MEKKTARWIVQGYGWGLALCFLLLLLFSFSRGLWVLIYLIAFVLPAVPALIVGLLMLRYRARKLNVTILVAYMAFFLAVIYHEIFLQTRRIDLELIISIIGLLVVLVGIYLLGFNKDVKALFEVKS